MPEEYGRRLLCNILHQEARDNPQRTFAIIAKTNNVEDGFLHVTFGQLARAVNYVANWLLERFENHGKPAGHPTLSYLGISDLRYNIIFYAAVQCGYKVFLPSPRNTTAINVSLLEQTECSKLVYSPEVFPVVKELQQSSTHLRCEQLPSLEELLAVPASEFQYETSYAKAYKEPILILHSSGSTRFPKTITMTHGTFATFDVRDFPTVDGRITHDIVRTLGTSDSERRMYDIFPIFHIAGATTKLVIPLIVLTIPIFGPPLRPPSGTLAAQIMKEHKPRSAMLPPSIVEQLYHEPGSDALFKQLDVLLFAGGPLPKAIGDQIVKHTTLAQFFGSTETGQIRQLLPQPEDWEYIQLHPSEPHEFQPTETGLYELVLFGNEKLEHRQSLCHIFPGLAEWRTKDLFQPHPSKPDLWKFHARADDILVFSSGEKLYPVPLESYMTALPGVTGALVVGQKYPQAALVIELAPDAKFSSDVKQDLWPAIEEGNKLLPDHGRVSRSMIIVADPDRPFLRAGKGTVIRRLTEELYAKEIRELYERKIIKSKPAMFSLKPSTFRIEDIKQLLRSILNNVSISDQIHDDENLYTQGMDSVKTVETLGHLKASLQAYKADTDYSWLTLETIYLNPTINQIASIVLSFLNDGKTPARKDSGTQIRQIIGEFTVDLPKHLPSRTNGVEKDKYTVAITGTTGFLGNYLLGRMIENPHVSRVYCLNRSKAAHAKFMKSDLAHKKDVIFLTMDFRAPKLGLTDEDYSHLVSECTLIVHNAWLVDFNLPLDLFEDSLQSIKSLIHLSAESSLRPRILFVSSISATGVWGLKGEARRTIPEEVVDDPGMAMKTGYAESKQIAEQVLKAATSQSNTPVTIIRLGQLVAGNDGYWPKTDILSVFLRTSKAINLIASDAFDTIDWIPVDEAAAVINDIVNLELTDFNAPDLRVFNIVNPHERPWQAMVNAMQQWCGSDVGTVSLQKWHDELQRQDTGDVSTMERLPALRVLPVIAKMAQRGPTNQYDVGGAMAVSKHMSQLVAPSDQVLESWLHAL